MKKPLRSLTALFLALLMLAGCSTSPAHDIVTQAGKQLRTAASEAPSASDSDSAEIPSPSPTSTPTAAPTAEPEPEPTPEPEPLALTDGVVLGRRVFVHENGVAFWGAEEYICSALLDSAGNLYDFCVEGLTNTRIVGSAILDSYYYMSTYDGIFRFALADLQTGNNGSELLCDDTAYDGFSIYNGAIYYQDDDALLTLPIDGGEPQTILSGIEDCEITNQGIFYTNMTEGLYLMDPDTRDSKRLIDCPAGCHIALRDSTFYLWASREVLQYNYATGATRSLTLAHEPDMEEHIWPSAGDTLVYTGTDDEIYSYDLSSDSEITLSSFSTLPDKGQGCFPSNVLYYIYTDTVYWDDVIAVAKGKMDLDDFATVNATPTPDVYKRQAVKPYGINYSRFMNGLKKAGIDMNRKMLSELAINDATAFAALVETAKNAL